MTKKKTITQIGKVTMHHMNYTANAKYNDERSMWEGRVIDIEPDEVVFESVSFVDLSDEFHKAIENYLRLK